MSWALQGILPSKEHLPQDSPGWYGKDIFCPALISRPTQVFELRTSNQNTENTNQIKKLNLDLNVEMKFNMIILS